VAACQALYRILKMTIIEKLIGIPISGKYQEIIFDLPAPWTKESWNYVKFTQSDGTEWCGAFREKQDSNFLVAYLSDKGVACIVSGGHGQIIDVDKKEKIFDIWSEPIIDLFADEETNTFYISSWSTIILIDNEFNEFFISVPIECDGIYFRKKEERKLRLEIEEISMERRIHLNYFIDLNDRLIRENAV